MPVKPEVPAQLLEPTPISTRQPVTYRDLAILATEHLNSAQQANDDKAAIKQILAED
ncbi:Rz1-like lysis system protein LysC [Sulfitobacter sp. M22]|uniref:Rz1-like lysis system protein LysC n=1 Tax=Sulfitobacter sp. M22 TaxID=2675332 RepID=UPI001F32717D